MNKALLCTFVLLTMGVLQAQPQEPDSSRSKTAILFNVVSLNLQGYNGGVGLKYWIGKTYAIQAGMDFNYSDNTRNDPNDFDKSFTLTKSIGFSVDILKYFYMKDNLQFYCGAGAGPMWQVERADNYYNSATEPYKNESRLNSLSLRANILFGAEYVFNKTFALSFQQILSGSYSFGEQETVNSSQATKQENESLSLSLGSSSLILSIYF